MKRSTVRLLMISGLITMMGLFAAGGTILDSRLMAQQTSGVSKAQPSEATPTYDDVAAIISKYHCTVCHGGPEPRAGLSLGSYASLMKGGKDGPVVIAGDPAKSELIQRIKGLIEPRMPFTGPPWLTDEEIQTLERWIAAGAPSGKK